jgi:serine/threonine-protein kinase
MGQVWAARLHGTRGFQKLVAVKTILPSAEDAGHLETMLFEEASLAALVRHPNVAETLDLGEREDGTLYLVMEWVSGEPLDHILAAASPPDGLPFAMLVRLAVQALCGLRAVHEARNARGEPLGIVHRDVSPQNLLVTYEGVVKIIDFGIAKATQQMSRPTEEGMVKGKFAYMSPEQLRGEPVDARADLFSLGVVLYRATTGMHPFQSDNLAATMRNILLTEPQRPTALVPGYPRAFEEVVLKALSKERSDRFLSAHEMMLALEQAVPEACVSGIDQQCERFLRQLFADRISERARALQVAMKAADAAGSVKAGDSAARFPQSLSTMRAVSRETVTANGDPPAEPEPREAKEPIGEADVVPAGLPSTKRRAVASIATAAVLGVALLVVGLVAPRLGKSSQTRHALAPDNGRYAPGAPALEDSSVARPRAPAPPSEVLPAPSPSPSSGPSSASFAAPIATNPAPNLATNRSRSVAAPKKRPAQLAEPAAVAPASANAEALPANGGPPAGGGAPADPLTRRK